MSFLSGIKAFEAKALAKANDNTSKIVKELFEQVVVRSPSPALNPTPAFAKGHLANQWYPVIGNQFSAAVSPDASITGSGSLARVSGVLLSRPFQGKDNIITLANNVDYAYRAEVLGWPAGQGTNGWIWSKNTGPYMMVRGAMQFIAGKYII